jgi:hypothetical protein
MAGANVTADMIRSALDYDPDTGVFRWKRRRRGIIVGSVSGCINLGGYRVIVFQQKAFYAHRLAWLYVHGEWPTDQVDHINGDRLDNRIANLREAGYSINAQNRRSPTPGSKIALLGVSMSRGLYRAQIWFNGTNRFIGRFPTAEAAYAAYVEAKRIHHQGNTL